MVMRSTIIRLLCIVSLVSVVAFVLYQRAANQSRRSRAKQDLIRMMRGDDSDPNWVVKRIVSDDLGPALRTSDGRGETSLMPGVVFEHDDVVELIQEAATK